MPKPAERWVLFTYDKGVFTPLSNQFRTRKAAEKARLKYPERQRKSIGIGLVRT